MLTKEQVLEQVSAGRKSECLDGRDYSRLADFFPVEQWGVFGFGVKEGADLSGVPAPKEWSRKALVERLAGDLSFGFEKALNKRGISAGMMHEVVKMWLWVLEDDLLDQADDLYAQYGLPLFKAVALKYDLPNEIGDDDGDERKYSA